MDHKETAKALKDGTRGLGKIRGRSFAKTDFQYDSTSPQGHGSNGGSGHSAAEEITYIDFDRWYNLNVIKDVTDAVSELQAARENLSGRDYTESLAKEIKLLQQQASHTERYMAAQKNTKTNLKLK